jgi:transposase InsO family protein
VSVLTTTLRTGLRITLDGEVLTVVEMTGRRMLLRSGAGDLRQVDIGWVMSQPGTRVDGGGAAGQAAVGAVLSALGADADTALAEQVRHVQEVLTGYQLGSSGLAGEGEPRPQYAAGVSKMARYAAKAAELGVSVMTVRRMIAAFRAAGPAGLAGGERGGDLPGRADPRWAAMCQTVLAEHVEASRPTRAVILVKIEERLCAEYGRGTVPLPGRTKAYELLAELTRGSNAFTGSTKGKRSIASRPAGVYGRLRATRPGEYVLLDTTRLDVFAMEPVTCRWVQAELSVAMDLFTRCITGLRLTPVSTKAVDVAAVLYETVRPRSGPGEDQPGLAYLGVPGTVVVDARKLVDGGGRPLLPSLAAETIVYDHGKVYLSHHVQSVCAKMEISLQPARTHTPTDKSPLERWFRTLSQSLLVALPGYKGSDVHSRGLEAEDGAFYFLGELEAIIREWVQRCYHCSPHTGLCVPEIPGLDMSPLDMLEHGIARAGSLQVLDRPDLACDFLEVRWTTIQHYGVEIDTLRYNGPALNGYRGRTSSHGGTHAGKWPVSVDTGDVTRVWFQDPSEHRWHPLAWEHAAELGRPFSAEAAAHARRLAATTHRFPDTKRALVELLDRWDTGLTASPAERRMAVRLSAGQLRLTGDDALAGTAAAAGAVSALPSVARIAALSAVTASRLAGDVMPATAANDGDEDLGGDDDEEAECDVAFPGEGSPGDGDFYADVLESS